MAEALRRDINIPSLKRRSEFRRRMIDRFEAEWVLAALRAEGRYEAMDPGAVQDRAGIMVATQNEDEILEAAGRSVPPQLVERIFRVYDFARSQVTSAERKYLPNSRERRTKREIGRTVIDAAKVVVWRSLCDPASDVYKMWFDCGIKTIVSRKVVGSAVALALAGIGVGWFALAASLTAIIFKMGIEVYCEGSKPEGLMIGLKD